MKGLKEKKYIFVKSKRFDPFSLLLSSFLFTAVLITAAGLNVEGTRWIDPKSLVIVVGGSLASLLFQFDLNTVINAWIHVWRSFFGTPSERLKKVHERLDQTILESKSLSALADGSQLTGELINDVLFMSKRGLLYEEIDEFITSRIKDEYQARETAVLLLERGASAAPTFGLMGTVLGLVQVLKSLNHPAQIGPFMSVALMTTAYGVGLSSLLFAPLAGRLSHYNSVYLESYKQVLTKISILLKREERSLEDSSGVFHEAS